MKKIKNILWCSILLALSACGGGSPAESLPHAVLSVDSNIITTNLSTQIVRGISCDLNNTDISPVVKFWLFQLNNRQPYHCLQVNKADGHPTHLGDYSYRFELRPDDCTWSNSWNDCTNDRSRTEIEDDHNNAYGKEIIWDYWMYIPEQNNFKPAGTAFLSVSQVLAMSANNYFGLTQLLISKENKLVIRPLQQYSFITEGDIPVVDNPFNKWINIRYEVKASATDEGYLRVIVNGKLILEKYGANVLDKDLRVILRLGIYNSSKSRATEPYNTQIMYFDTINKIIK